MHLKSYKSSSNIKEKSGSLTNFDFNSPKEMKNLYDDKNYSSTLNSILTTKGMHMRNKTENKEVG